MYEERRPSSSKGFILKLLLFIVIIVLIVWLFPTKNYVSNLINSKLGTSKEQVFNNNLNTMKTAALSYYSGDRLPEKEGVSDKITLEEMLEKKLLIEFTDSNGKKCNKTKSYVEVTKNQNDYSMKVNLSCQDGKNYIISYIDAAGNEVYSKKKLTESDNNETSTTEVKETNTNTSSKTNECEYVKNNGGYYSNYGAWSNWSTSAVSRSNTRNVETKIEKVVVGTDKVATGTTTQKSYPTKLRTTLNGEVKYVYVCPSNYDNAGAHDTLTMCIKTITTYSEQPLYKNVVYYRYQDRKYISGITDYKWSSCSDDNLLNQGYTLTGNKR